MGVLYLKCSCNHNRGAMKGAISCDFLRVSFSISNRWADSISMFFSPAGLAGGM